MKPPRSIGSVFGALGWPLITATVLVVNVGALVSFSISMRLVEAEIRAEIKAETAALSKDTDRYRVVAVADAVDYRIEAGTGRGVYFVGRPSGAYVLGNIVAPPPRALEAGWHRFDARQVNTDGPDVGPVLVLTTRVDGDFPLLVGRQMEQTEGLRRRLGAGALIVSLAGTVGSLFLLRAVAERFERRAERVAAGMALGGDRSVLTTEAARRDELGRLAASVAEAIGVIDRQIEHLGAISTVVAHETRAPLGAARRALCEPAPAVEEALDHIEAVEALVLDLLDIARIESAYDRDTETVALTRVFAEAESLVLDEAAAAGVVVDMRSTPLNVQGERLLLVRLYTNLLLNAIEASSPGGVVTMSAHRAGGMIETRVRDEGPGLDASSLDAAIKRERKADETGGTGTGLRMVRAIALRHGARVRLSNGEPGLQVSVSFPRSET